MGSGQGTDFPALCLKNMRLFESKVSKGRKIVPQVILPLPNFVRAELVSTHQSWSE